MSLDVFAPIWRRWATVLVLAVVAVGAVLFVGGSSPVRDVERWRTQLLQPVAMAPAHPDATSLAVAPGEAERLYVIERGHVAVVDHHTGRQWRFLDLSAAGRQLVDLVFHPDYARNRVFYVLTADRDGTSHVFEFRSGGITAEPNSGAELLVRERPEQRLVSLTITHHGDLFALDARGTLYRLVARSVRRGAV